jgi:hypothetical protein
MRVYMELDKEHEEWESKFDAQIEAVYRHTQQIMADIAGPDIAKQMGLSITGSDSTKATKSRKKLTSFMSGLDANKDISFEKK